MDKNVVKTEKSQVDKLKKAIDKLKAENKSLPINKRIADAKKKLKEKRAQKASQIKKMNDRVASKREMRKKASKPERKATLLEDINTIKESIEEKRAYFDAQIEEMLAKIEGLEKEKVEKSSLIISKIEEQNAKLDHYFPTTQWGMHKYIWEEMNQYIDSLIKENLNTNVNESVDQDDELSESRWINSPNAWQIGNLTSIYWAKIHPSQGPLGLTYNVGYAIAGKFKWVPKNIDDSLIETLKNHVL